MESQTQASVTLTNHSKATRLVGAPLSSNVKCQIDMDSKANVLANNAFRYEIYCLLLWPVIWAFFAFVLSGWWVIGGFTLGLIISAALSFVPAVIGITAIKKGTEFKVRAYFPSVVIICLLALIALWYGIWI